MHLSGPNVTVFLFILLLTSPLPSTVAATSHDDSSFLHQVCSMLGLNEDQCCTLSKAASFAGYATAAATVGTVGIPALLASMGFSATGITAGSWAAWYQATYGIGSTFSWFQSVAMTGWAAGAATKLGVATAAFKSYFFSGDCKKNSAKNDQCSKD